MSFLLLVVFFAAAAGAAAVDEFTYTGFASANLTIGGVAEIESSGILRLTNVTSRLIGHAFYPSPLRFRTAASFSTAFAFATVPEYPKLGGHGLAFVLAPTAELRGALPSQYLGLLNASDIGNATNHVFAVEFDTVQDFEFGDINDNHVGVDINTLVSNASAAASYVDGEGVNRAINLKSGDTIMAWVDYDGSAKVLNVSVSPESSKPAVPLISFAVDLASVLEDEMFVGFSASTGLLSSSHYLMGWSFKMNGAAPPLNLGSLPALPKPPEKPNTAAIVAGAFSAFVALAAAGGVAGYLYYKIKNADVIEAWELDYGPHRFDYGELRRATRGFRDKELLGTGGFGKVYRGTLPSTGAMVAVKRVSHESRQGMREFVAEIASIGRLRHRNLVQLLGWCRRRRDLLLVYDYMPNGSLDKYLFDGGEAAPALGWAERYKVIRGVAAALLYLHEEWEAVVMHRDVKASNVLLDADFNARLGDFGLAKLYEHGGDPSTTRVVGTLGYLAPELTRTGRATTGADVFAFGALVLETVCGRRPVEPKASSEELVLVDWVWEKYIAGALNDVVDRRLAAAGGYDPDEAAVALILGLWCSHPDSSSRPTMRTVVHHIDKVDRAELPSLPALPPAGVSESRIGGFSSSSVGFDAFLHSYPSSAFDHASPAGGDGEYKLVSPESV